jgi:AcrR family transcriptional regulator
MPKAKPKNPTRGPGLDPEFTARRQERILEVATTLFAEHGFQGTDTQQLADALGVGKGTLYRYFANKEALFLAAVDRGMRLLQDHVNADVAGVEDPLAVIARATRAFLAYFDAHPELAELIIQERATFRDRKRPTYAAHRDANIGPWQDLTRSLIAAGRIRDVAISRLDVVSDFLYGIVFTNHFAGRTKSFEEQATDVIDLMFCGILSDRERRRWARGPAAD